MPTTIRSTDYEHLPVSLESAKDFARVTTSHEDPNLRVMLRACIQACETYARVCMFSKEVTQLTRYHKRRGGLNPGKRIYLTEFPAREVESVRLLNSDGVYTDIEESEYGFNADLGCVIMDKAGGRVLTVTNVISTIDYVEVKYKAGYLVVENAEDVEDEDDDDIEDESGEDSEDEGLVVINELPADMGHAVRILFAHFYENRGVYSHDSSEGLPSTVRALLDQYRFNRANLCY